MESGPAAVLLKSLFQGQRGGGVAGGRRWKQLWWGGGGVTDEAFVGGWWRRGAPRTVCTDSKAQSRWLRMWSDDDR